MARYRKGESRRRHSFIGFRQAELFQLLLLPLLLPLLLQIEQALTNVHAAAFVPAAHTSQQPPRTVVRPRAVNQVEGRQQELSPPPAARARGAAVVSMKQRAKEEGPGNNAGANLFVDRSCNGCGTCRALCPGVFGNLGLKSAVLRDPKDEPEKRKAFQAMATCPYGAIRLRKPDPLVRAVLEEDFPIPVDSDALPGVFHLGYHHKESMGAAPYLIVRGGGRRNIMVDGPRFNGRLAKQVEALGGVAYHVITHEGAAPDHDLWHAFFPTSERVAHRMDVPRRIRAEVEAELHGKGPWFIDDDVKLVGLPGYTPGSIGLIHRLPSTTSGSTAVLFSGRTVGYSPRLNRLDGFAQFARGQLAKQADSIRALATSTDNDEDGEGDCWGFEWILPAEGLRYRFPTQQARRALLLEAADLFEERGRVGGLSM